MRAAFVAATLAFTALVWQGVGLLERSADLLEPGTTEADVSAYMTDLLAWADTLRGAAIFEEVGR